MSDEAVADMLSGAIIPGTDAPVFGKESAEELQKIAMEDLKDGR